MSFTSTVERQTQVTHQAGTILLSPSKKRKVTPESGGKVPCEPTTAELWRWTFTHDAIASCFIKDVHNMKENTGKEADFFWLGRVPCRTIKIVGLIVGITIYEKRIKYTIDDGTSVIDCSHRQTPPPRIALKSDCAPLPPPPLKPISRVGTAVLIIGKVTTKFDVREITVSSIERCVSSNDEPTHWRTVCTLHKSSYYHPDPFVIPVLPAQPVSPVKTVQNGSPQRIEPYTPSDVHATPASSVTSSPVKMGNSQRSPPKLRHPSRLSSRHLTDLTFQKYMMHYMHHTVAEATPDPDYDFDTEAISYSLSKLPSTPTKLSHFKPLDKTPRAGPSRAIGLTPRPQAPVPLSFMEDKSLPIEPRGFTLSYLRRVPELADMARRVVKAEAKRRAREERKKVKEAAGSELRSKSARVVSQIEAKDKVAPRAKRLFEYAAVQLLREGSIVLWDSPVRPLPGPHTCANSMWKADSTSNSTIGADSTIFSSTNGTQAEILDNDDDAELSDPEQNEEAYYPITPKFMALHVEMAIEALGKILKARGGHGRSGYTSDDILKFLRKDDRWRYAGSWHVNDALDVLKMDGRAWCIGKGKWELTV